MWVAFVPNYTFHTQNEAIPIRRIRILVSMNEWMDIGHRSRGYTARAWPIADPLLIDKSRYVNFVVARAKRRPRKIGHGLDAQNDQIRSA